MWAVEFMSHPYRIAPTPRRRTGGRGPSAWRGDPSSAESLEGRGSVLSAGDGPAPSGVAHSRSAPGLSYDRGSEHALASGFELLGYLDGGQGQSFGREGVSVEVSDDLAFVVVALVPSLRMVLIFAASGLWRVGEGARGGRGRLESGHSHGDAGPARPAPRSLFPPARASMRCSGCLAAHRRA